MSVNKIATTESGAVNGYTLTRVYTVPKGDGVALLNEYVHGTSYTDGYFDRTASTVQPAVCWDKVSLVFTATPPAVSTPSHKSGGTVEWNLSAAPLYVDLEELDDFKMCWKFDLYKRVATGGTPGAAPAWAATDTDPTHGDGSGDYLWSVEVPNRDAGDGKVWMLCQPRTVRAKQKMLAQLTVRKTVYFDQRSAAQSAAESDGALMGTHVVPSVRFGGDATLNKWLVTNVSCHYGKINNTEEIEYSYAAAGWDETLYL